MIWIIKFHGCCIDIGCAMCLLSQSYIHPWTLYMLSFSTNEQLYTSFPSRCILLTVQCAYKILKCYWCLIRRFYQIVMFCTVAMSDIVLAVQVWSVRLRMATCSSLWNYSYTGFSGFVHSHGKLFTVYIQLLYQSYKGCDFYCLSVPTAPVRSYC